VRAVSDFIEVPIDNWIAGFDGRVLEIYTPYQNGSMRFHARLMVRCWLDGNLLTIEFARRERGFWPFTPEQRPQIEALVEAVEAARTA
jgi:hypothetical protein